MHIHYYQQKIARNSELLDALKVKIKRMPLLKLLSFFSAVFFLVIPFQTAWNKPVCFSAAFAAFGIFIFLQNRDTKYLRLSEYYKSLNRVYENEVSFLNRNYAPFYNGERFIDKKHEYSYDLDIFGENSLFHRINRTITYEASAILAQKLSRIPDSDNEITERQKSLEELARKEDFRFRFIALCSGFNGVKNKYDSLLNDEKERQNAFLTSQKAAVLMYISISITFLSAVAAYFQYVPWSVLGLFFTFQLIFPAFYAGKAAKSAADAGKWHKNIARYTGLLALTNDENFSAPQNAALKNTLFTSHNSLEAFKKLSSILEKFDQRNNVYVLILLNGLFLSDLFLLRKYWIWKKTYLPYVQKWIETLAELEARVSLAGHVFNSPHYTLPRITNNPETLIQAAEMGHPFIDSKNLITNDFLIQKKHFSIITGANMSGKSTFLRTVGVNYIMAINGMRVCAADFRFSVFKLFSSMRNTDDLSSGISYFNAELIRIEQLIDFSKTHEHTLIILDEILKGTNSKDKLTGSVLFLKKMSEMPVTGIIATHDLELAKLEDENPDRYRNFCFEINLSETIDYAYKIQRGVSKNMNATFLLKQILYPS